MGGPAGVKRVQHAAPWAAAAAAAVILPLLRQQGARSWDTIWAEDGWLYFQQAHDDGLTVLLRGFAGYLQFPTRLLAAPSPVVPIGGLSMYLALVGVLVAALLAWFVYWASGEWVANGLARAVLALFVVLMPALGLENTADLTNLIWLYVGVTPWAFLVRAAGRRAVLARSVIVFAAASASLLSLVLLPLAGAVAAIRRDRATSTVVGAYAIGLLLQVGVTMSTEDDRVIVSTRQLAELPEIVSVRLFGQYLLGDRGIDALWDSRWLVIVGAPVVVLVALLGAARGVARPRQLVAAGFVALAVGLLVVPVWGRGTNQTAVAFPQESFFGPLPNAGDYNPNPARFSVAPVLVLAGAFAVLVSSDHRRRRHVLAAAFAVHLALVAAFGFRVTNARSAGPEWRETVETARVQCERRPPEDIVELALPDPFFNPPIQLPCADVTG